MISSVKFAADRVDCVGCRKFPILWKLIRFETSTRCILGLEEGEPIFPIQLPDCTSLKPRS